MFHFRDLALAAALALAACGPPTKPATVRSILDKQQATDFKKVDAIFSAWAKPNSPGCALGVLKDGHVLYSHGYGLADIEHSVPITPATVFQVGSVSKQFTAFAIYLLAQDGKLSIDDDIRKYLPELYDFPQRITIRQLLHHTSGFRDDGVMLLAGRGGDDEITEQYLLSLAWRQRELEFPPGQQFMYSNMGYVLLAVIVERVSGMSFRAFMDRRIFAPLGMSHTHVQEHYGDLMPGRAYSYLLYPAGYRFEADTSSYFGSTNIFTTVEDLRRWDENFYTGEVGGKTLLTQMQAKGKLNNGQEIDYASGLYIREYRGLKIVEHGGEDHGFQSELLRFPEQHFSVIVLCNAGDADPSTLARKTADIFLNRKLKPLPPAPPPPAEIKIDPKRLEAYVGDYGLGLTIAREGDQLVFCTAFCTSQPTSPGLSFPIFPSSERKFFAKAFDEQLTFDTPQQGGKAIAVTIHSGGLDYYAKRTQRLQLTSQQLQQYVGSFYSAELDKSYTVLIRNGKLFITDTRRNAEMFPTRADAFDANFPFNTIEYQCTKAHRCNSFVVSNYRVRRLRFRRVDLKPVDASVKLSLNALERFSGHYELQDGAIVTVRRDGGQLLTQTGTQPVIALLPEDARDFFADDVDEQVEFEVDERGNVVGLVQHLNGANQTATRISEAAATQRLDALMLRIKSNSPRNGSRIQLRHLITELSAGTPDFGEMSATLAEATRQQLRQITVLLGSLGDVQSLDFIRVAPNGLDIYRVKFNHGVLDWGILLTDDGKIGGSSFGRAQ